jgi:hypothetical protein
MTLSVQVGSTPRLAMNVFVPVDIKIHFDRVSSSDEPKKKIGFSSAVRNVTCKLF